MPLWEGRVTAVEISDQALSAEEILQRYANPLPQASVPYSLDESREPDLHLTRLTVRWADGCVMTYRLTDEALARSRGLARNEAVREMNEQHEFSHAQPREQPCEDRHHDHTPCPLCDVLKAQRYVRGQIGVSNHTLVVPEWVHEWMRVHGERLDLCVAQPIAATPSGDVMRNRRYCSAED